MAILATSSIVTEVSAQEMKTSYFLTDKNIYAFQINPASRPDERTATYFGVALGCFDLNVKSNIGLSDLFFMDGGRPISGLNSDITADQFLSGLANPLRASLGSNMSLLSFGARAEEAFFSMGLNLKTSTDVSVPKELAEILKKGGDANVYSLGRFDANTCEYAELSFNYSWKPIECLAIGIGLKGIAGIARVDAAIDKAIVNMNNSPIDIRADGTAALYCPYLKVETGGDDTPDGTTINPDHLSPAGYGAAIDLGAKWATPLHGLSVDLAFLDIGAIAWKASTVITAKSDGQYTIDELSTDVIGLRSLTADKNIMTLALPFKANLGAKYVMPFYDRMSAGLLCSYYNRKASRFEARIGVDVCPVDQIDLALSLGRNSFGNLFGAIVNFRVSGVNLFAGIDGVSIKVNPQFIPVKSINTTLRAGMNIVFENNVKSTE